MRVKRFLILSAAALFLTGVGISAKTGVANASQPPQIIRYLNNRNNHCYYGYYYKRDQYKAYPREYYVRGYMPKYLRHYNKRTFLFSPYYNSKIFGTSPTLRKGRTTYYKELIDHRVRNRIYNYLCINQHDIEGHYSARNASYYRWANRTVRRDKQLIRRHRGNRKYIAKMNKKMFNPEVALSIEENNRDLFKHPSQQKSFLNRKYFPRLFRHRRSYRRHYQNYQKHYSDVTQNPIYIEHDMARNTIKDIDDARRANGIHTLTSVRGSALNQLSEGRAHQIVTDFSHDHTPSNIGENIAAADLGNTSIAGDPNHYNNHNGAQMAQEVMDSFMNYDGNQGNVHRDNILNPDYRYIGVGVYAPQGKSGNFYLVEDFY